MTSGLYYKHITTVNYDSSIVNKFGASLTDNARVIIYDRHMFKVQAQGCHDTQHNDTKQSGLICDTQHNGTSAIVLRVAMPSVAIFIVLLRVVMLNVVMLSVVAPDQKPVS